MNAQEEKINVLLVDDDQSIRDFLTRLLGFEGVKAKTADNGYKALELAQKEKFDLIFLDIKMPSMNGLEAFSRLKKTNPRFGCVFMTGYALEQALLEKTKQPGTLCLKKPFDGIPKIKEAINKVLEEVRVASDEQKCGSEKRAFARLNLALGVDYRMKEELVSLADPAVLLKGWVTEFMGVSSKDISPGGIRLITAQRIASQTILELLIKAKSEGIKPCGAFAEVVWNKESPDKPGEYEMGLEFIKIDYAQLAETLIRSGGISMV